MIGADQGERERRDQRSLRALLGALALAALGLLGAIPVDPPGPLAGADPLVLLVWLAIAAPAAGCAAAALGLPGWPFAAAVPGAWAVLLVIVDGASERDLATPVWATLALAGLFYAGFALGLLLRERAWSGAALALVLAAALVALPLAPGGLGAPWPPAWAARLLDLSPASLVAECGGVDWMRQPAVYAPAGTDRFERRAFDGALAGTATVLVGCSAWALAAWFTRRARG